MSAVASLTIKKTHIATVHSLPERAAAYGLFLAAMGQTRYGERIAVCSLMTDTVEKVGGCDG
jgi:hypothetical protein